MNSPEINLGGATFDSRLRAAGFHVYSDWNDQLASEMVEASTETAIITTTPRDHLERFSNPDTAQQWFEKTERSIYSLRSSLGLAGIFWLSTEPYRSAEQTIAIRLYDQARGKRLAIDFAKTALYHNERWLGHTTDTWLETGVTNLTAQHTFERLGYNPIVDPKTPDGRLRMIRAGTKTRYYNEI